MRKKETFELGKWNFFFFYLEIRRFLFCFASSLNGTHICYWSNHKRPPLLMLTMPLMNLILLPFKCVTEKDTNKHTLRTLIS